MSHITLVYKYKLR